MQLNAFFEDREAVSPVIGVILMVAITVILAAVIGTFVLGLGDQVGDAAPNANWDTEAADDEVTFTHNGGDSVDPATLNVTGVPEGQDNLDEFDEPLTAGDTIEVTGLDGEDGTANLVWQSGDRSSILASQEYDFTNS
ncbi:type IV pilin N-terminal domain-containing protein [Halalkaliarchaeum sp. AArc-GB]|uniref:type IV pilin N-terminal domain-containing protein n=1 Tax=Halalkaliarchaeum sp. AArc-GB TaxID=3074078 RepID=UPI00285774BB|nr:type IV pilin N-terminal domain-containing protein [Halalkaliarchaeum sp. AArc-GB]MDR5673650.1 type IV pilin N-terminal domain-containing protein [Halalkaliarchaeum sp. AArc-GB]